MEEIFEAKFELTPMQQGVLFHTLYASHAGLYVEQVGCRIHGPLDVRRFERAWQMVIARHQILRASFEWQEVAQPQQRIHRKVTIAVDKRDWRQLSPGDQQARLNELMQSDREQGFDLSQVPLMRLNVVRLAEELHHLLWSSHHVLLDGWSQSLVLNEVIELYRALVAGSPTAAGPSRPFADYVRWLKTKENSENESFWRELLRGFDEPTTLGIDRVTSQAEPAHAECELTLSQEATSALQSFARRNRLTLYTLVQGAWAMLLSRYSGAGDVIFGSTVSTRPLELEGIESTAGLFINTLPVRVQTQGETLLIDWLKGIQLSALEAREFECASLADIQAWSELAPRQPLFESILVFENYPTAQSRSSGAPLIEILPQYSQLSRTNYPLVLLVMPSDKLRLQIVFDTNRFESEQIEQTLRRLAMLLEQMAQASPDQKLSQFSLLTWEERDKLLRSWNNTAAAYESEICLPQLFEQQVAQSPGTIAVAFDDNTISYAELNARANQLAHYLRRLGVGPEVLVGICLERSIEMVVGLLGILKAGGAYVPLDPAFPKARLAFMLQDSGAQLLLTEEKLCAELPDVDAKIVSIDSDWKTIGAESSENLAPVAANTNLAYVIYTSGSTGKPKGVQIEHRALANFLSAMQREPGLDSNDLLLAVTTLSFDIAGLEIYLPLIAGARLVIASREIASDGSLLQDELKYCGATIMQATPATWRMLIDSGWQGDLRLKALCGGEALPRELANDLLMRCRELWNMYGPTETTIWSTLCKIETANGPVSIGRPIANTQIFLLGKDRQPVPAGIAGELCIGGDGLARGYLGRPELTAEKFIENPFVAGQRLYRTGDLARYRPDGRIECLGRIDDQVKIRGYRIETGEIESALTQHPDVRHCAVVACEDSSAGKRLVAYLVSNNGAVSAADLRRFLKERLPEYMMPSAFVPLKEFPLTPNGKVNRRALPPPEKGINFEANYVEPRNVTEETLASIWREVLGIPRVGAYDDFFDLGGHSLLATRVASRALKEFQIHLPLRVIFESPTVEALAQRIEEERRKAQPVSAQQIQAVSRNGYAPLSHGQESFWFLNQLNPNTPLYNIYRAMRLRGALDLEIFKEALVELVKRHEALRTTFVSNKEGVRQRIAVEHANELRVIDLRHEPADERELKARLALSEQAHIPFELDRGRLLRCVLVRMKEDENILLVALHHIIVDDWSMSIFFNELWTLYNELSAQRAPSLAELPIQYADFAVWQRDWLRNGTMEEQLAYWKEQLGDLPPVLELPTDRPRLARQTYASGREEIVLPRELSEQLTVVGRQAGATLFMTLLTAFQLLLARYTGLQDIAVGSPVAGRNRAETEALIGYFINTLVLRTDLSGNPTFAELLRRVREMCLGAFAHQDVPFGRLVEDLQPTRALDQPPLFQVLFVYQNAPVVSAEPNGISITAEEVSGSLAPLDLTIEVRQMADGLHCFFEYRAELFAAATIARMAERFRVLLDSITADPNREIWSLEFLTASERRQLVALNDVSPDYSFHRCVHELFEAQVERTPSAIAVIHENEKLTYSELNQRANQLAHYLRELGVGPETLVGICSERSLEMIVGILGILKAGGAYVPLDPAYPRARLRLMIDDAKVSLLLTQQRVLDRLPDGNAKIICLDSDWERISEKDTANPARQSSAENLAYVIYTSGSTGTPKGVMIEHRSLVSYTETAGLEFGLGHGDRVMQFASLSFDTSAEEIFPCLTRGAKLVLRTDEMLVSATEFFRKCREWAITVLDLPTAYWHELAAAIESEQPELPSSLRLVIIGGERAQPERLRMWQQRAGGEIRLVNTYGPTETTIVATMWEAPPEAQMDLTDVPIGRPVKNASVYVLDSRREPTPAGIVGELYIGGAGLARGYLNQPQLTAEKFIRSPFGDDPQQRLYKTGDLGRYLPDGNIEYQGRADDQVKIRGFRIELGEIESVLRQHDTVRESVVVARDVGGDRRLVAYVIAAAGVALNPKQLREYVREKLPEYMLPSALVELAELPLTPSGKVNRQALPAPDYDTQGEAYVAARTQVEELLCGIWGQILKVKRVGMNQNFFELGGHSLLATQVISRVRDAFQIELPLRTLFESPTIAGLAERVEKERRETHRSSSNRIEKIPSDIETPLSFAQERMWFIDQFEPNSSLYNICRAARLRGKLKLTALRDALNALVLRHEALRTNFVSEDGRPRQVISQTRSAEPIVIDLREKPEDLRESLAQDQIEREARASFDLATGSLFRVTLLRLADDDQILIISLHHIICDGWSVGILYQELTHLYECFVRGDAHTLLEQPIQFADYAYWERQWVTGEFLETQLDYWKEQLKDAPAVLELPTDRVRPPAQTFNGSRERLTLPFELAQQIKSFSQGKGATLFMTLMSAFFTLLYRYSGQQQIVVGSPIAGRNRTETEGLIGLFVNTLALRVDLAGNPTSKEVLDRTREVTLAAYAHQEVPFEKLVEALEPERNLLHHPLFQVMFVLQNALAPGLELTGTTSAPVEIRHCTAKFDLTLEAMETTDGLACSIEYNSDLFDAATVKRMLGHYQALLESIVENGQVPVADLSMLTERERRQLLVEWNETSANYPANSSAAELFEAQAALRPDAVALIFGEQSVTYGELNERANQLASYLRKLGVGPEVMVGLCLDRSIDALVGILGIIKAGGAYVPIDPAYPKERLAFMLKDTQTPILLTQERLADKLPEHSARLICLDQDWETISRESKGNLSVAIDPDNLIYVMYTSGSTGTPKGVLVTHRNVVRLVKGADYANFSADEVFLQFAPISFDASTFEIFGSLLNGAKLVIMPPHTPTLEELGAATRRHGVTTLWLTTGLFHLMVENQMDALRRVKQLLFGGDVVSTSHVRELVAELGSCRSIHCYGPTENTTFSTCYLVPLDGWPGESVPIGYPISNSEVYILDSNMQPVPVGVPGEVYLGGDGLARGYLNRPELTEERFVPNPFSAGSGARLYKTGDFARYLPDGNIQFLGRLDHQVKIRGFRVEPGEIETVLGSHPAVRKSIVVARSQTAGDKSLSAYVLPSKESAVTVAELRDYLHEKLPEYMVPSLFVLVEDFQLTPEGKIDRRALPAPGEARQNAEEEFIAPRDELEQRLVRIWEAVLEVKPIALNHNFFELGGHSLMAVRLFAQIEKAFGKHLPLATLFQAPTPAQLAEVLRAEGWSPPWSSLVAIQPGGSKPPFFCVHAAGGNVLEFHELAQHLGPDQPFYAFQAHGLDGKSAPYTRVEEMAAHYIKEMREFQPKGPYLLGGRSFGGTVAFEIACQLRDQGEEVGLLALLDTYPVGYFKLHAGSDSFSFRMDRLGKRFKCHYQNLRQLSVGEKLGYLFGKAQYAPAKIKRAVFQPFFESMQVGDRLPRLLRNIELVNFMAASEYVPKVYHGSVSLFCATGDLTASYDLEEGWRELVSGNIEIHEIDGDHINIIKEPFVGQLAQELKLCLDAVGVRTDSSSEEAIAA